MELTEEEIIRLIKLIEASNFNELRLEVGDLKLIVSKGGRISAAQEELFTSVSSEPIDSRTLVREVNEPEAGKADQKTKPQGTISAQEGLIAIKATMLGVFYRCPEVGAPAYVEVGTLVEQDDTVCLIEVMKVFTAVRAGVHGYIDKICVESSQMVEYGQVLFLVKPDQGLEKNET